MGGFFWLYYVGALWGLWLISVSVRPARCCPNCGQMLPSVRLPRSFREALRGAWRCPHCGALVNRAGQKIDATQ